MSNFVYFPELNDLIYRFSGVSEEFLVRFGRFTVILLIVNSALILVNTAYISHLSDILYRSDHISFPISFRKIDIKIMTVLDQSYAKNAFQNSVTTECYTSKVKILFNFATLLYQNRVQTSV
jgi:hypothetical protein